VSHLKMIYAPAVTPGDRSQSSDIDVVALARALESRTDDVAMAMHELAHLLVSDESIELTLRRVSDLAARVIDDCDAAGVTLVDNGGWVTAAWTDERTLAVDRGQYERGDGPCLQAIRDADIVRLDVDEAEERWPDFVRDARAYDVRSFLAAPLLLRGEPIGALNLYSAKPSGFTALDDVLIALFTGQVSVAVGNAKVYSDAVRLTDQLQEAIGSRAVIEQAKGVLMAREGIDVGAAFERLKQESQDRNVKLRNIAKEVVDSTQRT
jgi:GAF domain-containing protein